MSKAKAGDSDAKQDKHPAAPHQASTFSYSPSKGPVSKDTPGGQLWLQLESSVKRVVRKWAGICRRRA